MKVGVGIAFTARAGSAPSRRRLLAALLMAAGFPANGFRQRLASPRVVWIADVAPSERARERIARAFASHGLLDGRNLSLEFGDLAGVASEAIEDRLRRVVAGRPAAIVRIGSIELIALHMLTKVVPIVFYNLGFDPAAAGFVESLRRPGGNMTGTTLVWREMLAKQVQLLKEIAPRIRRVAYLGVSEEKERLSKLTGKRDFGRVGEQWREAMTAAGRDLGVEILAIDLPMAASGKAVGAALQDSGVEAVVLSARDFPSAEVAGELIATLTSLGLPAIGVGRPVARAGLLLSMAPDFAEGEREAVAITARILKGESPATIPVFRVTRYFLFVNARTARAMGLEIPASLSLQARETFE